MSISKILLIDSSGDVAEYRVSNKSTQITETKTACPVCESGIGSKQNHAGSPFCENGSLASGGRYVHCQCDVCSAI